jgi:hypothetical protein
MDRLWLEQEIATQLDLASAWLTRTDGTTDEEWARLRLYEDSGSSLRIPVRVSDESCENWLRIVEACLGLPSLHHLLTRHKQLDPLVLTDGAVSIEAALSPKCHRSLRARLPHIPFAVRKYTLHYTPYGPPRHRISFTLNSVNPDCRANTNKEPVGHLRPIHLCEEVIQSAYKLRQIRIEADRQCFGTVVCKGEDNDMLSPMEPPGEEADNEESHPYTQTEYGTQVVHRTRTPSNSTARAPELSHEATSDNSRIQAQLLGLLFPPADVAPPKSVLAGKPPITDGEGAPSSPRAMRENPLDTGHPRRSNTSPDPTTHSDAPKAPSAGGFTRTSTSHASNECVAPPADRMQSTRLPPSYPRAKALDKSPIPVTANPVLEDLEPEWLKDTCRADGCGRVPGAQQKLLSSWQKQRAGANDRFPHANVPIQVFNALQRFKLSAASSDTETSDEEESSDSNAHSHGVENVAIGDVEDGTAFKAHLPAKENDESSDGENNGLRSWSSSPIADSPKAPFRPGPNLPPDSSLPDTSTASQVEPQEASFVQEAQRVVVIQSSNEEITSGPDSSPPLVSDGDDSDMDMELDLPRGLEEGNAAHNIPTGATVTEKAAIVLVKETPYLKEKNPAPRPRVIAAQLQQQASSGTSKDTSSTSIIYGTYQVPSSSMKSVSHDTEALPSGSAVLVSSYDGHKDNLEPTDVRMEDADDENPQSSPLLKDERQYVGHLMSFPKPLRDSDPHIEPEQPGAEDGIFSLVSPGLSPMSGQRSQSETESNVASHAKRKFEHSPSKRTHRPPKRGRFPIYKGFGDFQPGKVAEDLERRRIADYEDFKRRERTASPASNVSDNSAKLGAQSTPSPSLEEANRRSEKQQGNLQQHSIVNVDASERDGLAANGQDDVGVDQKHQRSHRNPPYSTSGGAEELHALLVPDSATRNANQSRPLSPTPALQVPEDVDMEIDIAAAEDSNTRTILIESTEVDEIMNDHAVSGHNGPRRSRAGTYTPDTSSKTVPLATTHKGIETSAPSKNSASIFDNFKATYPAYTGDSRHFLGQCKQMKKLDEQDKMVPKWQWDDFIIRNRTDYRDYANQCMDSGEDAEPYYRFYKDRIRDTLYTKGITGDRKTLAAAIGELESGTAAEATAATAEETVAKMPKPPPTRSSRTDTYVAKGSTIKAPPAKMTVLKAPARSQATVEVPSSVASVSRKPRQSLPSAFNKRSEASTSTSTSTAQTASKEHTRQSLPATSSRGLSFLPPSSPIHHSTPAKQPSRLQASSSNSTRRPSLQRTSSGPRIPAEPTGDPYKDFVFGMRRAKGFTGNESVGSPSKSTSRSRGKNGG